MIEDVATSENDDVTENPKASSEGKPSTNMTETQLERRRLDRLTNSVTTASHERYDSVGEMNLEPCFLWSNGAASSEHLLRSLHVKFVDFVKMSTKRMELATGKWSCEGRAQLLNTLIEIGALKVGLVRSTKQQVALKLF